MSSWSWLRNAEPGLAEKTAFIRLPHDYLTEKLTGNGITDRGDASGTGWWSSRKNEYVSEILNHPLVGLETSMLPKSFNRMRKLEKSITNQQIGLGFKRDPRCMWNWG